METAAHFDNIPEEISRRFNAATAEIILVGNWFSEHSLFDALCQQAGRGLPVRLVVPEKEIMPPGGRLNLQRLRDIGGTIFELPEECGLDLHMPHRFCVIDRHTVILGDRATQASEKHITVISNSADIGVDYLNAFDALLRRSDQSTARDNSDIRHLLDTLGHYALLEEWEAITARLAAHHPTAPELQPLLAILENRDSWAAIDWIDNFLANTTALTVATDQDIELLRLNLRSLELQFTALSNEKAEIDRLVHAFSLRTNHEVGKLLTQYLELRARKLRQQASREEAAQEEADRAWTDYEEYRTANERSRENRLPPQLPPHDLKELKRLYRQTCQKCHPDKVNESNREQANQLFVQLQTAYRNGNLAEVRAIHAAVRDEPMFVDSSKLLDESQSLQHAITLLQRDLERLYTEIHELRRTEAYCTCKNVDDWDDYFVRKRASLELAISQLRTELADHAKEA